MAYHQRSYPTLEQKPYSVTHGVPYIIDPRLAQLRRLAREVDRSVPAYKGNASCRMIFDQFDSLYRKVFRLPARSPKKTDWDYAESHTGEGMIKE